jgi:cell division FtsZ-interacting protein ZapD
LYLRDRKDKDIIEYLEPLIEMEDFSSIVRGLIRDGVKFRTQGATVQYVPRNVEPRGVLQSNNLDFSDVKLEKKEVDPGELDKRLSDF